MLKIEFKQFPVALRSTSSPSSHENEVKEFVWGKTIRKKPKLRIVHTNKNVSPKLFCFVSSVVSWGFPYIGVEPVEVIFGIETTGGNPTFEDFYSFMF